jgi:hypothetical protein
LDLDDRRARARSTPATGSSSTRMRTTCASSTTSTGASPRLAVPGLEPNNVLNTLPLDEFLPAVTKHA